MSAQFYRFAYSLLAAAVGITVLLAAPPAAVAQDSAPLTGGESKRGITVMFDNATVGEAVRFFQAALAVKYTPANAAVARTRFTLKTDKPKSPDQVMALFEQKLAEKGLTVERKGDERIIKKK